MLQGTNYMVSHHYLSLILLAYIGYQLWAYHLKKNVQDTKVISKPGGEIKLKVKYKDKNK